MNRKKVIKKTFIVIGLILTALLVLLFLTPMGWAGLFYLSVEYLIWQDGLPDQLVFVNESASTVTAIQAGDTPITKERFSLETGEQWKVTWEQWPVVVELYGGDSGKKLLGSVEILEDPYLDARDRWYVIAQDSPDGIFLTVSHSLKLDQAADWASEKLGVDVSDGNIRMFASRHGGLSMDGEYDMVIEFSDAAAAELEQSIEGTLGWHTLPTVGFVSTVFCGEGVDCKAAFNHSPFVPQVEEGWYFYHHTRAETDAEEWTVGDEHARPTGYTTAIYDSEMNVLYVYDFRL